MGKHTIQSFIKKAQLVHGDLYDYSLVVYKNCGQQVEIICPNHGSFYQRPDHHWAGSGCKKCANENISILALNNWQDFFNRAKKVHGDKYEYNKSSFKGFSKQIEIFCKKHGWYNAQALAHAKGVNCLICANQQNGINQRRTDEYFLELAIKTHGDIYEYDLGNYKNSHSKIKIYCKKHQYHFEQRVGNHLNGKTGCSYCKVISRGECEIASLLLKNKIKFETQKTFADCLGEKQRPYKFDFFLEEINTIIEYDGEQHFAPVKRFGGFDGLKKTQKADGKKNQYCLNKKINLIRINFDQKIEEELIKHKIISHE